MESRTSGHRRNFSFHAMMRRQLLRERERPSFLRSLLSLGQYFDTLKSDSHAELSFLQFLFYPKNLSDAPHPLTLCLRPNRGHDKYQPNRRTLLNELINIE